MCQTSQLALAVISHLCILALLESYKYPYISTVQYKVLLRGSFRPRMCIIYKYCMSYIFLVIYHKMQHL